MEVKPITEVILGVMGQNDAVRLEKLLGKGCTLTFDKAYLVRFPKGTTEEAVPTDPRYQEETLVKLPDKRAFRKCVKWPCTRAGCTHTYLFVPEPEEGSDETR